ncbi:MAG: DUF5596 domain-containing protein [Planctomycetes bacterium]|nr:DUF5596 domain-containing protein [Planctomycetota bacterium]
MHGCRDCIICDWRNFLTMNVQESCAALEVPCDDPRYFAMWDESQQSFDQAKGLLDPVILKSVAESLHFPDALIAAFVEAIEVLAEDEAQLRLMWHSACQLKKHADYQYFLPVDENNSKVHPLCNAIVLLYLTEGVREAYKKHGIPVQVCEDTLSDLLIWLEEGLTKYGYYSFGQAYWLKGHYRLDLFRIGRLQFEIHKLHNDVRIYQHKLTGDRKIIHTSADAVRDDGLFVSCHGTGDEMMVPEFFSDDALARGAAIDAVSGRIDPELIEISLDDWELVLEKNDDVLGVHIAASGPMDTDLCTQSFADALPFFAQHFPDFHPKCFHCSSWLLSPFFAGHLKATSNIVKFQQPWSIFPAAGSDDHEFKGRVWGRKDVDYATAEQNSSLQRAIVAHVQDGGAWNDMAGVLFPSDLPFGK